MLMVHCNFIYLATLYGRNGYREYEFDVEGILYYLFNMKSPIPLDDFGIIFEGKDEKEVIFHLIPLEVKVVMTFISSDYLH